MKLIIGLGNPGEKYQATRHNLGFMILDHFLQDALPVKQTNWEEHTKLKSALAQFEWKPKVGASEHVVLAKPLTFMNNSGMAVGLLSQFYKVAADDIWIVHDDIDLQLGALRIRNGGSSGGHKGIASVIQHLGTESFWRFRAGVGHPIKRIHSEDQKVKIKDVEEFVLNPFGHDEKGKVRHLIDHSARALAAGLEHGLLATMNSFNTR